MTNEELKAINDRLRVAAKYLDEIDWCKKNIKALSCQPVQKMATISDGDRCIYFTVGLDEEFTSFLKFYFERRIQYIQKAFNDL